MIALAEQKSEITSLLGWSDILIQPLMQHGSDRSYFRLRNTVDGTTVILMIYGTEKAENAYFADIQLFLEQLGIAVPKIIMSLPKKRWIFLEDLGDSSLYSLKKHLMHNQIDTIYCAILKQIAVLYGEGSKQYAHHSPKTNAPFDSALYTWEHEYFCENYLTIYRGEKNTTSALQKDFQYIARKLSNCENRLIHRDLQSKNILLHNDTPYLIDFQGLRQGLPEYDLASLIHDPYMNFNDQFKYTMFKRSIEIVYPHLNRNSEAVFSEIFTLCSVQRLFQALGAFCFLGIQKDKHEFLSYIAPAEKILSKQLKKLNLCAPLLDVLTR